jgi:hypothetical protein
MGDSQYWASLRGAGLLIFLFLFCLFLGVAVFAFFYDRISTFEIWNSPIWLKLKMPLIVLGVIGFLVALIAYIRDEGRRELQTAQDYAQAQGWGFLATIRRDSRPRSRRSSTISNSTCITSGRLNPGGAASTCLTAHTRIGRPPAGSPLREPLAWFSRTGSAL